jgi:quercetin dioxygenase-like cupin family protein
MTQVETSGEANPRSRKTIYFKLDEDQEWNPTILPADGSAGGEFPDTVRGHVDVGDYFRDGLWTRRQQIGSMHLLEMKLAPNFSLPRHHHNLDQLVLVLEGEARQGNRRFHAGDGYFTPAFTPYSTSAGPDGCRLLEIRHTIEGLTAVWDEADPQRWQRSVWAG